MDEKRTPRNCLKCVHFSIDWTERRFPRCCAVFSIKTNRIPSAIVFEASGKQCVSFEQKDGLKK